MDEPTTPRDVYKAIIDELVSETRLGGSGSRVAESGIYSPPPAKKEFNEFVRSMSPQQRELLSRMLADERDSTIHDVLAALSWWVECENVGFTVDGKPMPVDLSGGGLHYDYTARREGDDWPEIE